MHIILTPSDPESEHASAAAAIASSAGPGTIEWRRGGGLRLIVYRTPHSL